MTGTNSFGNGGGGGGLPLCKGIYMYIVHASGKVSIGLVGRVDRFLLENHTIRKQEISSLFIQYSSCLGGAKIEG